MQHNLSKIRVTTIAILDEKLKLEGLFISKFRVTSLLIVRIRVTRSLISLIRVMGLSYGQN